MNIRHICLLRAVLRRVALFFFACAPWHGFADPAPESVSTAAFLLRDQSLSSSSAEGTSIPPSYSCRFWEVGVEAPEHVVQSITQTSDGILWLGTAGGLARFDGEHFEFVSIPGAGVPAKQKINVLCAGNNGGLWVGTAGQGLFHLQGDRWSSRSMHEMDGNILALHCMPDDSLWVGTRKGMALCRAGSVQLRSDDGDVLPGPEKHEFTETVRSMACDSNGDLWIAAGDHLMELRDGTVVARFGLAHFNPTYFRSICYRRDGSIWLGSNSGLTRFNAGEFTHFGKSSGLPDNVVSAVFEDSRGNLWIGTSAGLCRFANDRFVVEITSEGEAYDQILCLFEDRENNLWVGAKNGLYQLRVQQFTTYTTRHGLAHNNVTSIYEEPDGTMWVGTWGGGLHQFRDGKITIYTSAKNATMRNDLILALHGANDGGVWFGTDFDGGLYRLKDGEMTRYATAEGFGPTATRDLMNDSNGRLLAGTARESLYVFENGKFARNFPGFTLPSKDIRCLLEDKAGRLWIGTETGLACRTNATFVNLTVEAGLADNFIHSLYEDNDQSLWIGTARGLSRLRGGKFTSYGAAQGLFDDTVVEILEDDFKNLWLASRQGVLRVSRSEFDKCDAGEIAKIAVSTFGKPDGMLSPVCVGVAKPSAFKTRDGRLWFATTKGLAVTHPDLKIGRNDVPPPVVVREVIADKKVQTGEPGSHLSSKFQPGNLNLPPGNGDLEFRYTALSYAQPEKNRFKYKLTGFDSDWVDAGTRRTAFYNSVPPGSYEFRVIACNNDGVWNSTGTRVKLTLQPHYWQTKWFQGCTVFAAFGCVAGTARYVTWKRVRTKLARLEQEHAIEKERTRIAQDMHDELGARLTEIRVLSDLTAQSKDRPADVETQSRRISDAAGELIRNLHSIVWAVNPANDSIEKLADYIGGFAQPFLQGASIRCRLDRPAELPALKVSSEVRHNIVMALKESLNNIIKHAEASEVRISLFIADSKLTVSVSDNGKGFDTATDGTQGNGLQNMDRRMQSIKGQCQVLTGQGGGTTIQFTIPLKHAGAN